MGVVWGCRAWGLLGIGDLGIGVFFPRPCRGTGGLRSLILAFIAISIVWVALFGGGRPPQGRRVAIEFCVLSVIVSRRCQLYVPYFCSPLPGDL